MAVPKYRQSKMREDGLSEVAAGPPEEAGAHISFDKSLPLVAHIPDHYVRMGSAHMHHLMKALQLRVFDKNICLVGLLTPAPFSPQAMFFTLRP